MGLRRDKGDMYTYNCSDNEILLWHQDLSGGGGGEEEGRCWINFEIILKNLQLNYLRK